MKFEFRYSKKKMEFLDTLLYKDKNSHTQTTLPKRLNDCQNYLHSNKNTPTHLEMV